MGIQELCSGTTSVDGLRMKEQGSSGDGYAPKVRKPYTITKQRERWTEEEHSKFLEALQLHGRAWRRIEEYIVTKTAVQIRSHAQKFFSKVARESKPIEIPPPRPKRKPVHPYPRKMGNPVSGRGLTIGKLGRSSSAIPSASEQENGSPTSVLSALGSDAGNPFLSNLKTPCTSPVTSGVGSNEQDSSAEETGQEQNKSPTDASVPCLKLFGKTVMVADARRTSSSNVGHPMKNSKPLPSVDVERQDKIPNMSLGSPALPMLPMFCPVPSVYGNGMDRPWMFFCGTLPLPCLHQPNSVSSQFVDGQPCAAAPRDKVTQHECSWTGSNTADEGGHTVNSKCTEHARSVEDGENVGFVPYKRRVGERHEQNGAADDIEDRPMGLCL